MKHNTMNFFLCDAFVIGQSFTKNNFNALKAVHGFIVKAVLAAENMPGGYQRPSTTAMIPLALVVEVGKERELMRLHFHSSRN